MTDYSKITALYSRLSVGDEDRDGGESNSIQNQKIFLENYARGQHLTNIRHYIDDDESGRFFDRSAYSRMMDDVENGKIGVCIMKDLTRWGRDYLQVGNAMEIFRRNNVRFIAVNNGIDSEKPDTLEFAPFINIMSEWYAKDISKKVKTGIKTKGMSGKPIVTEAPYGYVKDPDNKDFWIIDEEAAAVVRLIFRLFIGGKNRNQIAVHLKNEQIPTPTFYMKDRGRGTCKNKTLNEDNRCKWNKATLTNILTRQEYCGDVVNFKTTKHFRDKHNHYVDRSQWHITENVHEPIISRSDFETVQRILENAPVKRPNGDGEIHPLSGLLFCKDCGAKMHIRIDYRNGGKRHVAYCSEYHKGKAKNPKCSSPHIMDADLLMQTVAEVLKKIEDYDTIKRFLQGKYIFERTGLSFKEQALEINARMNDCELRLRALVRRTLNAHKKVINPKQVFLDAMAAHPSVTEKQKRIATGLEYKDLFDPTVNHGCYFLVLVLVIEQNYDTIFSALFGQDKDTVIETLKARFNRYRQIPAHPIDEDAKKWSDHEFNQFRTDMTWLENILSDNE